MLQIYDFFSNQGLNQYRFMCISCELNNSFRIFAQNLHEIMKKTYSFEYLQIALSELSESDSVLANEAIGALKGSYSPYSHFAVGAALRLADGTILTGANQENASYPCTTCAERTVLNYTRAKFPDKTICEIAIVARREAMTQPEEFVSPCGLCRQTLAEVESKQQSPIRILLVGAHDVCIFKSVSDLLPFSFAKD